MTNTKVLANEIIQEDYKYGWSTKTDSVINIGKGLSEDVLRNISAIKKEPQWMLDIRLEAYKAFLELDTPSWGPDLSRVDFQSYVYFIRSSDRAEKSWNDVPAEIKETFAKIGIPEAEQRYLAGVTTQFESEAVYHSTLKELDDLGVIFCDTDTAVREYPELVEKYFTSVIPYDDNKFAALNTAVWSGGSFIYVPKNVHVNKPLQSYFRINSELMGQFERTLIIVDEGAQVDYVEGCTAPVYTNDSLHAANVEIIVHKNAKCRYTTVQNWSNNVINLVTKRAVVDAYGHMEWIDGNIGSGINMKYPSIILRGEYAKGTTVSIAFASKGMIQDAGAKMIHLAPNTSSSIVSKSIARGGGAVNYRGIVKHGPLAKGARSNIECDTILIDGISTSDTLPVNVAQNSDVMIQHEASVSKVSDEQLFYLMSRGIPEDEAVQMIIMGFIEPFAKELPMEYAVELNQLIKLEMEGSLG